MFDFRWQNDNSARPIRQTVFPQGSGSDTSRAAGAFSRAAAAMRFFLKTGICNRPAFVYKPASPTGHASS
jgi:hypothetical protein